MNRKIETQMLITSFYRNPHGNVTSTPTTSEINKSKSTSKIPIYYDNVRSITNKRNISMKIELSWYKILCFAETWLDNSISSRVYFPSKFEVYRSDRKVKTLRRSGGVAILVHHTLNSKPITSFSVADNDQMSEFLAVEVCIKPQPLVIYLCYLNVFDIETARNHYHRIREIVENYRMHRILVLGDFNLHDISWILDDEDQRIFLPQLTNLHDTNGQNRSTYHADAMEFLNKMMSLPLMQISNLRNKYSNVLDLAFVNEPNDFTISEDKNSLIDLQQQDLSHVPFQIDIDYSKKSTSNVEIVTIYQYAKGNYERLCAQLEAINFHHEFLNRDIDSAYDFFIRTLKNFIDMNIPTIQVKKYSNKPKWWTTKLQKLMNRCAKLNKRKETAEFEETLKEFKELRDKLYNEHIARIQSNIKSDPAEFWKFARINGGVDKYPNEMSYGEKVGRTTSEIVDLFAEYFESIYVQDEEHWEFDDVYFPHPNSKEINVSLFDIEEAIQTLKWKSGSGPDEIKPMVVKMCSHVIAWPMWLLYQKSFDDGKIADAMKISRVVPVHKRKGNKTNVINYRVVAIQPITMKVHEIAVKKNIAEITHPKLSDAHHGFRSKRSVVTNLLNLSILANDAFEWSCQLDVIYGDFKTAFDTVWIRKLVMKFAKFHIGRKTAKWLCEFLVGRTNYVQIDQIKSRIYESPSGVPPGSSLGPDMFTIFINDINEVILYAKLLLFADDLKLASIIRDHGDALRLQRDIESINKWSNENRLHFNKDKCYVLSIYRDNAQYIDTMYTLGDHIMERKDEVCDLGVWVNRKFHMGQHIELTAIKSRQVVGCIKHYSNGNFTKETQRILYTAYVRSRLEFASTIWNPASSVYIDDIESIQKQFVIYLLESRKNATSYRLAPYEDRCKQVKLQSLEMRRKVADSVLAYDIFKNNVTDDLISSKFVTPDHIECDLRDSSVKLLKEPRYRTKYLNDQPIARLIRIVNEYKNIVRDCDSRSLFKNKIMEELGMV